MESQVPNFDAMTSDDLWIWARRFRGVRPIREARRLFPKQPKGFVSTAKDLKAYAENKSVAMKCRARGEIQTAQQYERICEGIYDRLPDYARW